MSLCFKTLFSKYVEGFKGLKGIESTFSAINLSDSTSFSLKKNLSTFYVGNGGDNSGSSIKIQLDYELLKSQILDFSIGNGTDADVGFLEQSEAFIKENSLNIKDLGYFRLSHFEKIMAQKAYFLSRYKTGTNLYVKNGEGALEELDLIKLLSEKKAYWDLEEVYIGKQNPLAVRLVIEALPEEIKLGRIKKLSKQRANASKQVKSFHCLR